MSKKKLYLELQVDSCPFICSMEVLGDLSASLKTEEEKEEDNPYGYALKSWTPSELKKEVQSGGFTRAAMAATTTAMKQEADALKKAGFRAAFSYEGNHGQRVTVWVNGSKSAKLRLSPKKK